MVIYANTKAKYYVVSKSLSMIRWGDRERGEKRANESYNIVFAANVASEANGEKKWLIVIHSR